MEEDKSGLILGIVFGIAIGIVVCVLIFGLYGHAEPTNKYLTINQETGNDLCIKITGNKTAIAKDYWDYDVYNRGIAKGTIACELPSYDSTHNIVVQSN